MKKTYISMGTLFIILIALVLTSISNSNVENQISQDDKNINQENIRYIVNEEEIILINGISHTKKPGTEATTTTMYFGNAINSDIDKDGTQDKVFLISQKDDLSTSTSYYIVATLNKIDGVVGTYGYFIGKNISPQSTSIENEDTIVISYADTDSNNVKSISLKYSTTSYRFEKVFSSNLNPIVAENPEGESNPKVMKLNMNTWTWISTTYNDGKIITPKQADRFKLTFNDSNKTFSASTDCNGVGGEYKTSSTQLITFDKMMSTLMYCEGSQEADFTKSLSQVASYHFTNKGELVFDLKYDSGIMIFR